MGDGTGPARRATIYEVAQRAGVSHQTVTRYLRGDGGMKPGTRERVGAAITELDYRPNLVARAMRTRRTGRLAVLLPIGTATSSLHVLAGAWAAAREAGYGIEVVTLTGTSADRSDRLLELVDSRLYEGLLSLVPLPSAFRPGPGGPPVMVSGDYDAEMRSIGELANAACIAELIAWLAARGHRRFLHVAGDYHHTSARERRQVYLDTVDRLGLESAGVVDGDWSAESGVEAVRALPAGSAVTAVIAANDVVAAGVVQGARERGWDVPGDLSVTGWDNNPLGAYFAPTLTTVDVDHETLGRRAMARLVRALRGEPDEPDDPEPIARVVWRGSVGPAPVTAPR